MLCNYKYSWNVTWSHILTVLTNYRVNIHLVLPQQTQSQPNLAATETENPTVEITDAENPSGEATVPPDNLKVASEPADNDPTAMESEPGPSHDSSTLPALPSSTTSYPLLQLWKRKFTETQPEVSQLGDKVKKLMLTKSLSAQKSNDLAAQGPSEAKFLQDEDKDCENWKTPDKGTDTEKPKGLARNMKNRKQEQHYCKAFQLTDKFRVPINEHLKLEASSAKIDVTDMKPIPPVILIRTFSLIRVIYLSRIHSKPINIRTSSHLYKKKLV